MELFLVFLSDLALGPNVSHSSPVYIETRRFSLLPYTNTSLMAPLAHFDDPLWIFHSSVPVLRCYATRGYKMSPFDYRKRALVESFTVGCCNGVVIFACVYLYASECVGVGKANQNVDTQNAFRFSSRETRELQNRRDPT